MSTGYPPDYSADEIATVEAVAPYTMTSTERIVSLVRAVDYVVRAGVPGDLVECGVWRGGSMMAAARTLLSRNDTVRGLWLFDTFDGMPPPGDHDHDYGGRHASEFLDEGERATSNVWAVAALDEVRRAVEGVGYPGPIAFVPGRVEETLPASAPSRLAVLRIDTDWYGSVHHALTHLYPRLSPGGVLLIDDYGHWQGARRAVEEYFADAPIFLGRIDYTGRIGVKP